MGWDGEDYQHMERVYNIFLVSGNGEFITTIIRAIIGLPTG